MRILPFALPSLALLAACGQPTLLPEIKSLDAVTNAAIATPLIRWNGLSGFVARPVTEPSEWRKSNDDRAPKLKGTN
jgi:hypothetical protein